MASKQMKCIAFALFVLLLVSLGLHGPCVALAESERAVGPTPPRLASIEGDASFWRPGADDWAPARVNTPLAAGDDIYAGKRGNLEVEIGPRAFVRAGPGTEVGLESLETGFVQFKVPSGQAAFDLQRMPEGQRVEVDTPSGAFTIDRAGYYRTAVDDHGTTFITRRGGDATVIPAAGEASDVPDGQQVVLQGTDTATANASPAPAPDAWTGGTTRVMGSIPSTYAAPSTFRPTSLAPTTWIATATGETHRAMVMSGSLATRQRAGRPTVPATGRGTRATSGPGSTMHLGAGPRITTGAGSTSTGPGAGRPARSWHPRSTRQPWWASLGPSACR